jgi:hypothetical protein
MARPVAGDSGLLFGTSPHRPEKVALVVLIISIYAFGLYCSIAAVNFGNHPDEWLILQSIQNAFRTGLFIQRWYVYGSLMFDIGSVFAMFDYLTNPAKFDDIAQIAAPVLDPSSRFPLQSMVGYFIYDSEFHLSLRQLFAALSLLVVFPAAHLTWLLTGRTAATLFTGVLAGFCFELNYHARWIVGDALMALFGFVCIYLAIVFLLSERNSREKWLIALSSAAGAASASAKYTGAVFLLAPLLAILLKEAPLFSPESRGIVDRSSSLLRRGFMCAAIFLVAFVVLNPGFLLEPFKFWSDLEWARVRYGGGVNTFYDVTSWQENTLLSLIYTFIAVPSPFLILSALACICFALGIYWRPSRGRWALLVLWVPVLLFFALVATQRVMVVRNLLPVVPFVAVICGLGLAEINRRAPSIHWAVTAFCIVFGLFNGAYLWSAAASVQMRDQEQNTANLIEYIRDNPQVQFAVHPSVGTRHPEMLSLGNTHMLTAESPDANAQWVVMYGEDYRMEAVSEVVHCSTNRLGAHLSFGALESSVDFYPATNGNISGDAEQRYILVPPVVYAAIVRDVPERGLSICWPIFFFRWVY